MEVVADLEANGLNPDKIHCIVDNQGFATTDYNDMKDWVKRLTANDYLIGHNFCQYDSVVIKGLLNTDIKARLVDTLALSWYLFPRRTKHGLASWGEDFGIPKPVVDDWENLTPEEYLHRCKEDVKINTMLWELQKSKLEEVYGVDGYWELIEYLTFKMDTVRLQEEIKWKLDVPKAIKLHAELEAKQLVAKDALEASMPEVPKYTKKKKPAKPYKIDGTLSATGTAWDKLTKEMGVNFDFNGIFEILHGHVPPNAGSSSQVKDWLYSLGWKPETWKFIRDGEKERKVEQIKTGEGELCPSIVRMIKDNPELGSLEELGVFTHRIGMIKGFLKDEEDGYIIAGMQGLTNTLRLKHRTCVNIPSPRAPYGTEIRSLLTARGGYELCGSDMSNLEGRIKEHYVYPYDPEFVETVNADGYDGHLAIAVQSGMMTEEEANQYKAGDKTDRLTAIRHNGKTANYACLYGAGAPTIARQTGLSKAQAKKLHTAYWQINKAVKVVAKEQLAKTIGDMTWQLNPLNGFWYALRSEKDRFSTLVQGTATYCFDMWVMELRKKNIRLVAQFHDEVVVEVRAGFRDLITKDFKEAVQAVNKKLELNRDLDVDVEFGGNYSEVH